MFLKSYKVKSNTPLKSSEVKKLKQRIQTEFPGSNHEVLIVPKSNVTMLKLVTHTNVQTNVYCVDKVPMFFENVEHKLVPTVYSLWQVPDLLPYFTTHADVLPKLSNGANLMLPGVVPQGTGVNIYGHYRKGQFVAINLTSNRSAIGVGSLFRSSDDLYMCGGHGVAVEILHLFGDKLWGHEPSLVQQVPQSKNKKLSEDDFPALVPKGVENEQSVQKLYMELDRLDLSNSEKSNPGHISETVSTSNNCENIELSSFREEVFENTPEALLKQAFLSALKNNRNNLKLPILTSNFYRLYVVPESDGTLDIKKTKYKKLSNFLNEMIEEGFVVVREETKGVDKIISIDFEHPELVNFITDVKKPKTSNDETPENPLFHSELTEVYKITDEAAPLFSKLNYKRGSSITASKIKKVIKEYIIKQNLVTSRDSEDKLYILDECLETICNSKSASLANIVQSVISQMDHCYQMCSTNDIKGNKPLIQMSLATRCNRKKVTLVSNIECYGIILTNFIALCKQGAAASTTIVTMPNQKREMVQIQGNQIRFVFNLLTETYKIPPKCILGIELAKNEKKPKK